MSHDADSVKSIFFALGANIAIAIAKLGAAIFTGSGAMLAEAIHSFADSGNQLLLLLGLKSARRPPSPEYPLGTGKAIFFWSFIVALILFSMGGLFSIYEGFLKINHPHELRSPYLAIAVLLFSMVAESISLWGCLREVNKVRRGKNLYRWFMDTRQSELLIVFGEDVAALFGLGFALFAIVLTMVTGNPLYDALGTIAIGILLVIIALLVGVKVKSLLIGQGVEPDIHQNMISFLEKRPQVSKVYNLISLQMGADVMVAVKACMAPMDSADELIEAINDCERAFKKEFPQTLWLFFEPDIKD